MHTYSIPHTGRIELRSQESLSLGQQVMQVQETLTGLAKTRFDV